MERKQNPELPPASGGVMVLHRTTPRHKRRGQHLERAMANGRVSFRVPESLQRQIAALALKENNYSSNIIRRLLTSALDRETRGNA